MRFEENKTVLTSQDLMEELYEQLRESKDPDLRVNGKPYLMRLNKKSIEKIYRMLESNLVYYMSEVDFDGDIAEIRPFRGLVIQAENIPATEATNNLTGERFLQSKRRVIRAYISRYWRRKWSNLGT